VTVAAAPSQRSSLASSPDGQWVAIHRGYDIALLAGGSGPPVGRVDIGTDDADVAFVGPPSMIAVVVRNVAPRVMLYQPPSLEVVARHDLDVPMRIGAITGPRIVLVSQDNKKLVIIRVAAAALASQTVDLDAPLDFVVGLEKNQLLIGFPKKLEVWDATTGRPVLRMQLQLPPPPRTVGAAQGHIWVTRPSTDDVLVYRLSDGRPFRHVIGAAPVDVVANPLSPVVVFGTTRGLVRMHCFAHSLTVLDAPWTPGIPIAQLAVGEDISLLGLPENATEPWRIPIAGDGAPAIPAPPPETDFSETTHESVASFRSLRDRVATPIPAPIPEPILARSSRTTGPVQAIPAGPNWREAFAAVGAQLLEGGTPDLMPPMDNTALADLADRMLLRPRAIRTLVALYGLYLVGEPELSIADLAQLLGDWSEPLGTGELGGLGLLRGHRLARRHEAAHDSPRRRRSCEAAPRRVALRARRQERRRARSAPRARVRQDRCRRGQPGSRASRSAPARRDRRRVSSARPQAAPVAARCRPRPRAVRQRDVVDRGSAESRA